MTADHSVLNPLEGEIFVVDKPLGWSSFHVVKKLRGALTARLRKAGVRKLKVGHAGTLDPLATGDDSVYRQGNEAYRRVAGRCKGIYCRNKAWGYYSVV